MFIRHADPDYINDNLTPRGHKEADALAAYLKDYNIDHFYVSPLGRAQATCNHVLALKNGNTDVRARTFTTIEKNWLEEFPAEVDMKNAPDTVHAAFGDNPEENGSLYPRIVWDILPSYYTTHPELMDRTAWHDSEIAHYSNVNEKWDDVTSRFDELLAEHGYVRDGLHYNAVRPNRDVIACFCHLGVGSVLASHLMNVSPFVLWHSACMLPSSITEFVTEERRESIAQFRALRIGDISHLSIAGLEPSFAARFCETYDNPNERH